MTQGTVFGFVPFILALFAGQPGLIGQSVAHLAMQEEIILRVPIAPRPPMPQFDWQEHKGPKCVATEALQRAILPGAEDQVDFVLADHTRIRAQLDEDCPALDFYNGLYLETPDEKLCAGRDEIHSRMGGSCRIDGFKRLVPKAR